MSPSCFPVIEIFLLGGTLDFPLPVGWGSHPNPQFIHYAKYAPTKAKIITGSSSFECCKGTARITYLVHSMISDSCVFSLRIFFEANLRFRHLFKDTVVQGKHDAGRNIGESDIDSITC